MPPARPDKAPFPYRPNANAPLRPVPAGKGEAGPRPRPWRGRRSRLSSPSGSGGAAASSAGPGAARARRTPPCAPAAAGGARARPAGLAGGRLPRWGDHSRCSGSLRGRGEQGSEAATRARPRGEAVTAGRGGGEGEPPSRVAVGNGPRASRDGSAGAEVTRFRPGAVSPSFCAFPQPPSP